MTQVIGAAELRIKLDRLDDKIIDAAREVIRESAESLVEEASADAPYLTGRLAAAIESEYDTDGLHATVGVARGTGRAHIARYQEFGTSKMSANPFMTPQAEIERGLLPGRVAAHVRRAVE